MVLYLQLPSIIPPIYWVIRKSTRFSGNMIWTGLDSSKIVNLLLYFQMQFLVERDLALDKMITTQRIMISYSSTAGDAAESF